MPQGPDQESLVRFHSTLQQHLAYAAKMQKEYTVKVAEAIAVKPQTVASDLDRSHYWSMRNLYESQIRLLNEVVVDYLEQFHEYLPEEGRHE